MLRMQSLEAFLADEDVVTDNGLGAVIDAKSHNREQVPLTDVSDTSRRSARSTGGGTSSGLFRRMGSQTSQASQGSQAPVATPRAAASATPRTLPIATPRAELPKSGGATSSKAPRRGAAEAWKPRRASLTDALQAAAAAVQASDPGSERPIHEAMRRSTGAHDEVALSWIARWEQIANHGDVAGDEAAEFACERWRRAEHGERHNLWFKLQAVFGSEKSDWFRLTKSIRMGVPSYLRGNVWFVCSGAAKKRRVATKNFDDLVKAGLLLKGTDATRVIECDIPRTCPAGPQQDALERVLLAWAAFNAEIGYCQSMNYLAATFLLYTPEDRAFWTLSSIIEDLLPQGYYTPQMFGLRVDLKVFDLLVEQYLPALQRHLVENMIDLSPITMNWFLCLFVNTLPYDRSHRVLDCLLHEGSKVLFRVSLALLKFHQAELLQGSSIADAYMLLRTPFAEATESKQDCDALVESMYGSWLKGLSMDTVDRMRREQSSVVEAEDQANEVRRKELLERKAAREAEMATKRVSIVASDSTDESSQSDSDSEPDREVLEQPGERLRRKSMTMDAQFLAGQDSPTGRERRKSLGFAQAVQTSPSETKSWLTRVAGDDLADVSDADRSNKLKSGSCTPLSSKQPTEHVPDGAEVAKVSEDSGRTE